MPHLRTSWLLALSLLLTACAGSVAVRPEDRGALKNASAVHAVYYGPWKPNVITPTSALLGPVGAFVSLNQGKGLIETYGITDPLAQVRDRFMDALPPGTFSANVLRLGPLAASEQDTAKLKSRFGGGAVFEFWSLSQLIYYPTAWSKYRMQFFGFGRLLDLDSGKVLWQHKCDAPQDNKDTAPSLDELTASDAKRLKTWLDQSATECARQLAGNFAGS